MGLIYGLTLRIINFLVFFFIIVLIPGLPPQTTFPFKEFLVSPARELKGSLELNYHLEGAERLLDQRVYGPETLIARKNEIYTGIHGGEVIKINNEHVTHVAKFGFPCEGIYEEARCGRPLGMAFDTIGNNIIVADAYYGIWQVDLANGKKKQLISQHQTFEGKINRKAKIFNSVAVDKSGDIYWTDSSSDFTIENGIYTGFANPSGRLFHYNRAENISKVLVDELFFPNGLALSPEEDFVVVAETAASRLVKYHIKGPKKGTHETFVDGLPGNPDNLTPDAEGLWVPLIVAKDAEHPSIMAMFSKFPYIRMFLLRMLNIFESPFRFANQVFPNVFCQRVLHFAGHFESALILLPKRATIVRIDWNGHILGSLHGFDQSTGYISHVLEFGDQLYLGSPFNRFLARVKSPLKGQPQVKVQNVRYESANPTTTQKPTTTTTTTPKPTTTTRPPTTTKPPTTTTPKPTTTSSPKVTKPSENQKPKDPAPVTESNKKDTPPPQKEKLKVIKRGGQQGEL